MTYDIQHWKLSSNTAVSSKPEQPVSIQRSQMPHNILCSCMGNSKNVHKCCIIVVSNGMETLFKISPAVITGNYINLDLKMF